MFFKKELIALDYDCDLAKRLKISSAMRYMQQTSGDHLKSLGLPYEKLFEEDMAFLLSKGCIKVYNMPVSGQNIIIGTAPVATQGARFVREFTIDDTQGNRLISCSTLWLLVNPASRKIMRPTSFPYALELHESMVCNEFVDVDIPKSPESRSTDLIEIPIRYSHLDCNGHVNNGVYADFICDAIPFDALKEKGIGSLVISFQNEARHGDVLTVKTIALSENEYLVTGRKDGQSPCFEASVKLSTPE